MNKPELQCRPACARAHAGIGMGPMAAAEWRDLLGGAAPSLWANLPSNMPAIDLAARRPPFSPGLPEAAGSHHCHRHACAPQGIARGLRPQLYLRAPAGTSALLCRPRSPKTKTCAPRTKQKPEVRGVARASGVGSGLALRSQTARGLFSRRSRGAPSPLARRQSGREFRKGKVGPREREREREIGLSEKKQNSNPGGVFGGGLSQGAGARRRRSGRKGSAQRGWAQRGPHRKALSVGAQGACAARRRNVAATGGGAPGGLARREGCVCKAAAQPWDGARGWRKRVCARRRAGDARTHLPPAPFPPVHLLCSQRCLRHAGDPGRLPGNSMCSPPARPPPASLSAGPLAPSG